MITIELKSTVKFQVYEAHNAFHFICPEEDEIDLLTSFSIFCVDQSYGTRTCSDAAAFEFFEISKHDIQSGYVEKLIDKESNEFIGFYSLTKRYFDENRNIVMELGSLFVNQMYHRRGFGSIIFRRVLTQAKKFECSILQWVSEPDAAKFYEKCGGTKICCVPNVLNPKVPAPWFQMHLD